MGDRHEHRPRATFELRRQRHFLLTGQERDPAHVREIVAHHVAGRLEGAWGEVDLVGTRLARTRRRVHDRDPGVATPATQVVQHARRRDVGGQTRIDLLEEHLALLLPEGDQVVDNLALLRTQHSAPRCARDGTPACDATITTWGRAGLVRPALEATVDGARRDLPTSRTQHLACPRDASCLDV